MLETSSAMLAISVLKDPKHPILKMALRVTNAQWVIIVQNSHQKQRSVQLEPMKPELVPMNVRPAQKASTVQVQLPQRQ